VIRIVALLVACSALVSPPPAAQYDAPPTAEQLAARERVRPKVEAIWADARSPAEPDKDYARYFWEITDRLVALGPDVVPFLISEVDLAEPATYHFAAYALGQFPGPETEAALHKAMRMADARGGRFGEACKRFAAFSLALLGDSGVLDAIQDNVEIQDTQMVPDLLLMSHVAVILGPAGTPVLMKQLDAFQSDPEASDRLQFTLLGLGRTADASMVPTLLPLLKSPVVGVRAQAADTISRLGAPQVCQELVPMLSSTHRKESYAALDAFVRSKPEPCYKAIVARLEVEPNIEMRSQLYGIAVALGGESTLDVLRGGLQSKDYVERSIVADMIGRVGSKKGLNMLRTLLTDANEGVAARAVVALGAIGGEGATDTLVALTADRRSSISLAACSTLVQMGVTSAAPRIASALLEMVREPVGELALRAPIAQLTDALVTLKYTAPIDDLKHAIDVQADGEIKASLGSCVARLRLLAKNGEDPALWIESLASTDPDIRHLAERRLAEIGTPRAVAALESRLGRTDLDDDERAGIFRAFADFRTSGAASLVERNLSDAAEDAWVRRETRGEAAWAARRIGGERMVKALRASALRRQGRDWPTLVYLAALEKGASVETLKKLGRERLRRPESRVGREDRQLAEIVYDLAAGRGIPVYDVPPDVLLRR